jgi:ABC-type glucose/galactose transport system permease subunit
MQTARLSNPFRTFFKRSDENAQFVTSGRKPSDDLLSAKTDITFAVSDRYVSKLKDNMVIIAAVAVTAAVCIAGMYLLTGGEDNKTDIHVAVSSGIEDMGPFFEEFNENARAKVHIVTDGPISDTETIRSLLFNGNMTAVITSAPFEVEGADMIKMEGSNYAFYRSDGATGMTGFFINWLQAQAVA